MACGCEHDAKFFNKHNITFGVEGQNGIASNVLGLLQYYWHGSDRWGEGGGGEFDEEEKEGEESKKARRRIKQEAERKNHREVFISDSARCFNPRRACVRACVLIIIFPSPV